MDKQIALGKISFHYLDVSPPLRDRKRLKEFLFGRFRQYNKEVEAINYIFCTDDYLLTLNQTYLKHDTFTDIITFELSPKSPPVLSDIYISTDRVKENAKAFGVSFSNEILRVVFHGALHLIGFKDKSKKDELVMRCAEDNWLSLYNVPREKKNEKD